MGNFVFYLIAWVLVLGHAWEVKECYYADLFCESCTSLVRCIEESDGNFTKEAQGTCHYPEKCINGTCIEVADPICDGIADVNFPCRSVGIYPHPFHCNEFVLCVVGSWGHLAAYVNVCEEGYGYNIATDQCDVRLEGNQCQELDYPVPLCENLGQTGALEENPTLYYTCLEVSIDLFRKTLYPILDKCPHGQVYGDDFMCHDG